jgi:HME family heavy-metal exporter
VSANIGQPISHRLDHLLSGIRAEVAVKIFGDDLDTLSALATQVQTRLSAVPGLVDLQTEKQVRVAQQRVRIDPQRAAAYGIAPAEVARRLQAMANGEVLSQVNDGVRRFDVVLRLADADRSLEGLASLPVDTPSGPVPLGRLATIEDGDGPNQVGRESARRRIVVFANTSGRDTSAIIAAVRAELDAVQMPEGYFTVLEGQFQAQEAASRRIAVLALVSLLLVVGVVSNYTLFFSTLPGEPGARQRASLSVLLAASSTFFAFATLAFSSTPVLGMIGQTVAIGAAAGLVVSMVFSADDPATRA